MGIEFGKCALCGKLVELVPSNNPLVGSVCPSCLAAQVNVRNLEQADFFCRTYNLPFKPDIWVELQERLGSSNKLFAAYQERVMAGESPTTTLSATPRSAAGTYSCGKKDLWRELNEEWEQGSNFAAMLDKVGPIKQKFMDRARLKWGGTYTFEEYMQLDSLLVSTLRAGDITNPLQIDAIKKACRISIQLDQAIMAADSKAIKDLTSAYSAFTRTAQIDEVIESSNKDVISTVADLGEFIEQCGGQFTYYDGVPRDIVDKTIADFKEYIRVLVEDATGLGATLENIARAYSRQVEQSAADGASAELSIEELIADNVIAANTQLDAELAEEDIDMDDDDDDDDDDGLVDAPVNGATDINMSDFF